MAQAKQKSVQKTTTAETTKSVVTILLLLIFYPLGVLVMWFLTKWPKALKIVLSVLIIAWLFIAPIIAAIFLMAANPMAKLREDQRQACIQQCGGNAQNISCINTCMEQHNYSITQ